MVTTWEGGDPREGGRILAAGDQRLHEAAVKVLVGLRLALLSAVRRPAQRHRTPPRTARGSNRAPARSRGARLGARSASRPSAEGEVLDRLARHDLVVAGGKHQHRNADARREFLAADRLDGVERRLAASRWSAPRRQARAPPASTERLRMKRSRSEVSGCLRNGWSCRYLSCRPAPCSLAEAEHREPVGELPAEPGCGMGRPAIFNIGAVITMRLNQQPRLVAALNSTIAAHRMAEREVGRAGNPAAPPPS